MTRVIHITDAMTIPADTIVPATRMVRGADLVPGMVTVQWCTITETTRLALITDVRPYGGRITYDSASGGHGSTLPDAWIQILAASATADTILAEARRVLERWHANLTENVRRYALDKSTDSERSARAQLSVVDDVLTRLAGD